MNSCVCGNDRMYFATRGCASGQRAKLGHEMRIGQKAHIEDQVGIVRQAVFVSEAHARDQNRLLAPRLLFEAVGQVRPQFVDIKFGSVDDQVGNFANRPQMPPFGPSDARTVVPVPSGCGRRVSLKRRNNAASLASR